MQERAREIRRKIKANRRKINRTSILGSRLEKIEAMIQKSNIRLYVPYTPRIHLAFCGGLAVMGFFWIRDYMNPFVSIIFGVGLGTLPFLMLKIISDLIAHRVKQISVDFLIILKNFLIAGKYQDIFMAFERAADYVSEPLKSYIHIMNFEHAHKINPIQCLENFKEKIEVTELKIFIENLKVCYIHGGDIVALIDTFIQEIGEQNEDEDEEQAQDKMLNMGLYVLLLVNFIVMFFLLNSSYRYSILEPLWGQLVFAGDILISVYILFQSMSKLEA